MNVVVDACSSMWETQGRNIVSWRIASDIERAFL